MSAVSSGKRNWPGVHQLLHTAVGKGRNHPVPTGLRFRLSPLVIHSNKYFANYQTTEGDRMTPVSDPSSIPHTFS